MRRRSVPHLSHANRRAVTRLRGLLAALVVSAAVIAMLPAGSAWAQAPANDAFANATVIPALPFTDTVDTSQATADSTDAEVYAACGLSGTGIQFSATVWYAFTSSTDQMILIDTRGTTYTVGGAVVTGAPGSFSCVSRFQGNGSFSAVAGRTYYIDLADISGGSGGTLNVSFSVEQPPPPLLTVDPVDRLDPRAGAATVTGTITCPLPPWYTGTLAATVSQHTGSTTISGSQSTGFPCDGTKHPWSVSVRPTSARFTPGEADVTAVATACYQTGCASRQVQQTITLRT
jgi:Family of unknown function (DUF6299)